MDFNSFKEKLVTLSLQKGDEVRNRYIETFIDTKGTFYKSYIEPRQKFIDGYCYKGYLWDCLITPILVDQKYIKETLEKLEDVYVLWDIHSCERILIENYWKFKKGDVLKLNTKVLISGLEFLPEDIYIFDDSFGWTLIFTHEYIKDNRYCLKSGII